MPLPRGTAVGRWSVSVAFAGNLKSFEQDLQECVQA